MISDVMIALVKRTEAWKKVDGRVYPLIIPQDKPNPAIRVYTGPDSPVSAKDRGFEVSSYPAHVDVYADNYADASEIGKAVRDGVNFSGFQTINGYNVQTVEYVGYTEDFEEETNSHRHTVDFQITINR